MPAIEIEPASFRDSSGFIFSHENEIYRAIHPDYFENFSSLMNSGLYKSLSEKKLLVVHSDEKNFLSETFSQYKIIKPEKIPFISYPYEWSFSQLKDAALLTLTILKESLKHEIILKDASAYNIQFIGAKPIFIDTLSFEKYEKDSLWKAYRQFCEHFLVPLALMHYRSAELSKLFLNYIDGIPLELAVSLLPRRAMLNSGIATHVILHSKIQKKYSGTNSQKNSEAKLSKQKLLAMLQHLEDTISGLRVRDEKSNWVKYTCENTYSAEAMQAKEKLISEWLKQLNPKTVWDFGCNTGKFSQLASKFSEHVIAMDSDSYCIENFYSEIKKSGTKNILPLTMNLSNPSPAIGWANEERKTIQQRGKADALLALALVHHLAIGNNVSFFFIAKYFSDSTKNLIVEFIPKDDSQVKKMMAGRETFFENYSEDNFKKSFEEYFFIINRNTLPDSGRILYLMNKK